MLAKISQVKHTVVREKLKILKTSEALGPDGLPPVSVGMRADSLFFFWGVSVKQKEF